MAARLPQNDQNGTGHKTGTFTCIVCYFLACLQRLLIDLGPLTAKSVGKTMNREPGAEIRTSYFVNLISGALFQNKLSIHRSTIPLVPRSLSAWGSLLSEEIVVSTHRTYIYFPERA